MTKTMPEIRRPVVLDQEAEGWLLSLQGTREQLGDLLEESVGGSC